MAEDMVAVKEDPRKKGSYLTKEGIPVKIPENWCFTPSGDPGLTRRLKKETLCWSLVVFRKGRLEARGLWCDAAVAEKVKKEWEKEKNSPDHIAKLESSRKRREKAEKLYQLEFFYMVRNFLAFHPRYKELGEEMAKYVAEHACPVGSGTVARTERIPVEERAEAAVIAWMRHNTTCYDHMTIARIRGRRREVRRELAKDSRLLLERYRRGEELAEECPLFQALLRKRQEKAENSTSLLE